MLSLKGFKEPVQHDGERGAQARCHQPGAQIPCATRSAQVFRLVKHTASEDDLLNFARLSIQPASLRGDVEI